MVSHTITSPTEDGQAGYQKKGINMIRIPRRLVIWGGAAVVAGSGFAFMAGNSVATSSVGEGAAAVSGYNVSGISYQTEQGWGQPSPEWSVGSVKFTLTSAATSGAATAAPSQVMATLMGTDGAGHSVALGGTPAQGNATSCTISGSWTTAASGAGTGNYTCYFGKTGNYPPVQLASAVTGLDVEANQ